MSRVRQETIFGILTTTSNKMNQMAQKRVEPEQREVRVGWKVIRPQGLSLSNAPVLRPKIDFKLQIALQQSWNYQSHQNL